MNIKTAFLFLIGMYATTTACAQFYIGSDSLVPKKPYGYRHSPNTVIGEMEVYQDSTANQLLFVSNLSRKKIVHAFHYAVKQDSLSADRDYIFFKSYKPAIVKRTRGSSINQLRKYNSFRRITPFKSSDSAFREAAAEYSDGIDFLEGLWHVPDNDLGCGFDIYFVKNNPRHAAVYYYTLHFDSPCLNVKSEAP